MRTRCPPTTRTQRAAPAACGFSLLEMLIAIVIMGVSIALIYRSLGDGASKGADLLQRQQAMLLLEGLLQTPPDRPPYPLPQEGASGDLAWRIELAPDAPRPQLNTSDPAAHAAVAPEGSSASPQPIRYTVWWAQGQRQLSAIAWRLAPTAGQGAP